MAACFFPSTIHSLQGRPPNRIISCSQNNDVASLISTCNSGLPPLLRPLRLEGLISFGTAPITKIGLAKKSDNMSGLEYGMREKIQGGCIHERVNHEPLSGVSGFRHRAGDC
jgi:hypothetical protein